MVDNEGWLEKWNKSDIGFHQGVPNKYVSPQYVVSNNMIFCLSFLEFHHLLQLKACLQYIKKWAAKAFFLHMATRKCNYIAAHKDNCLPPWKWTVM